MVNRILNVLVIEDNEDDFKLMLRELTKDGLQIDARRVDKAEALILALTEKDWDVVISDNNIPDRRVSVKSSLSLSRRVSPDIPFIIVSGTIGEENAVSLLKYGANDYILKDNLSRLGGAVRRELMEAEGRKLKVETERKLNESQERYRQLAESIRDMFFALDKNMIITFWNRTAEKMTNIPSRDAVGRSIIDLFPSLKGSPLETKYASESQIRDTHTFELEVVGEGHPKYYMVTVYPSYDFLTVMVRDVSESKEMQRKISMVNEELETFIYRVSHDIRGPLASIQGLVNLNQAGMPLEQTAEIFDRIGQATWRLEDVVRNLQHVVSIRQETVAPRDVSVYDLVDSARTELHHPSCAISVEVAPGSPDHLRTDTRLIGFALQEIIKNAINYKHPARTPELNIRFAERDGNCEIAISDNGIGISEDVQDKIFRMFYRGSLQSTGSGLGLYLAINAVEKLGGTIKVKSTVGEGSVFTLLLPLKYPISHHPNFPPPVESYRVGS